MHHAHHRRARRRARRFAEFANGLDWAFAGCGTAPDWQGADLYAMGDRGRDETILGGGRRRTLRYLADRLELSRDQIADAARILERLKIERAQAEVDLRRTSADLADAIDGESFDRDQARGAAERRVETARRVHEAVSQALGELHGVLDEEQRGKLATLIRTRAISF